MLSLKVDIKGIDQLKRKLGPSGMHAGIRLGLQQSGLIVQEAAQRSVHSPTNPYIGKAGHSVATGRLQAALGTSDVRGSGIDQEISVGTPYGKTGLGTFARSARTPTGRGRHRQRTGGRRNTSDPNIYGPIEERFHPSLGPSLEGNAQRIRDLLATALDRKLSA